MQINDHSSVYTVSEINHVIKDQLENKFRFIQVIGEISNLATPFSGHSYFSLKDSSSQIRSVLFKNQKRHLDFALKDGQLVVCKGRISLYEPRGEYQLIVDSIEHAGAGDLQRDFEILKKKLHNEGLFDRDRKRTIPSFPQKVIVITSASGAALQDFLKIYHDRSGLFDIIIYPVPVQGVESSTRILEALDYSNNYLESDIIVICRGGGSLEDLWSFNDEKLARAIYGSKTPIITAIGHEIDYTIADFCSDYRCPTPTAAAEFLCLEGRDIQQHLDRLKLNLQQSMLRLLDSSYQSVSNNKKSLLNFADTFHPQTIQLQYSFSRLKYIISNQIKRQNYKTDFAKQKIYSSPFINLLEAKHQYLNRLTSEIEKEQKRSIGTKRENLSRQAAILDSYSPLSTLARGYSLTSLVKKGVEEKVLITDHTQLKPDDLLEIKFFKGRALCSVKSTKENN